MPSSRRQDPTFSSRGIHRFALAVAGGVLLLISAGALVTSKQAGLAVPDWPLSYGSLNPPRWWEIENVRAEHGHRLIAGMVALATIGLAVWIGRREPRAWVRRIAYLAVAAVLGQALLGGLTVLLLLPTPVSVSHAAVAELFLCLVVLLALVTSRWWRNASAGAASARGLLAPAAATTAAIYAQILLGAVMRHSGAGLAIPDFPLAFGRLVPPRFDFAIAIHYAHRLGAVLVVALVAWVVARALRSPRQPELLAGATLMAVLAAVQVTLGATVVLSGKAVVPNTVHVAGGALLLATSLLVTSMSWRLSRVRTATAVAGATRGGEVQPLAASGRVAR